MPLYSCNYLTPFRKRYQFIWIPCSCYHHDSSSPSTMIKLFMPHKHLYYSILCKNESKWSQSQKWEQIFSVDCWDKAKWCLLKNVYSSSCIHLYSMWISFGGPLLMFVFWKFLPLVIKIWCETAFLCWHMMAMQHHTNSKPVTDIRPEQWRVSSLQPTLRSDRR